MMKINKYFETNSLNVENSSNRSILTLLPPGWRSLIQSVTDMDDYCTNQSDYDTPTQEESEPTSGKARSDSALLFKSTVIKEQFLSSFVYKGQRSSRGNVQNKSPSARKAQRNKRETYR